MRNAIQPGTPDITWFPKGKAMCLKAGASDESVYDHIDNLQGMVNESIDSSTRLLRQEQTQKWTHTRRLIDDLAKQHRDLHRKIDDMVKVMHEIGTRDTRWVTVGGGGWRSWRGHTVERTTQTTRTIKF